MYKTNPNELGFVICAVSPKRRRLGIFCLFGSWRNGIGREDYLTCITKSRSVSDFFSEHSYFLDVWFKLISTDSKSRTSLFISELHRFDLFFLSSCFSMILNGEISVVFLFLKGNFVKNLGVDCGWWWRTFPAWAATIWFALLCRGDFYMGCCCVEECAKMLIWSSLPSLFFFFSPIN